MRTMDLNRWWSLPQWKRDYWEWILNLMGWDIERCFEFKYVGPVPVGAGLHLVDENGKKYLEEGGAVASEFVGIGY